MGDDTTLPSRGLRPRPIGKSIESLRTTALVLKSGKAQNEHMFSGLRPKADLPILELLPPPALRERCHRGLARRPHSRAPVCGPHAAKRPASTSRPRLIARSSRSRLALPSSTTSWDRTSVTHSRHISKWSWRWFYEAKLVLADLPS